MPLQSTPPPVNFGSATIIEDDEEEESGALKAVAIVGFVAAIVVLVAQLMVANVWTGAEDIDEPGLSHLMD